MLKLYESSASEMFADFDGISYGDVSEIIQSYFTNRSENWIEIFREHCS